MKLPGTKAASIREHIRQLKLRADSATNTPCSTPKEEKPTKPKASRAKIGRAQSPVKRRRTTSDITELGWGYLSDELDGDLSEAGTPSKKPKIKSEPMDDILITDEPEVEN
jgi:hypothetical protein